MATFLQRYDRSTRKFGTMMQNGSVSRPHWPSAIQIHFEARPASLCRISWRSRVIPLRDVAIFATVFSRDVCKKVHCTGAFHVAQLCQSERQSSEILYVICRSIDTNEQEARKILVKNRQSLWKIFRRQGKIFFDSNAMDVR